MVSSPFHHIMQRLGRKIAKKGPQNELINVTWIHNFTQPITHLDSGGLERLLLGGVSVRADLALDLFVLLVAFGRRPREAVPGKK